MRGKFNQVLKPKSEKARKKGMKWVKIDGKLYSWFGDLPELAEGAQVEFEYEESKNNGKTYLNLKELKPVADIQIPDEDRLMYRCVCLKAASQTRFINSENELIELAGKLEKYLFEVME